MQNKFVQSTFMKQISVMIITVIGRNPPVDKLQKLFGCGLHGLFGTLHDQGLKEKTGK